MNSKIVNKDSPINSGINFQYNPFKGFLYSLLATAFLSTNFVTAKYALTGFNPETFSLIWVSAATLYSFIIVLLTGRIKQLRLPHYAVKKVVLIGLTTGIGMLLGWSALARLDPSFTAFLGRFRPVLIIVLSFFFLGERLSIKELPPIAIMILGGCFSALGRWQIVGTGVILVILASCMSAVQQLNAKMVVSRIHPNIIVFYRVSISIVPIALWNFVSGKTDFSVGTSFYLVALLGAFLGPCMSWLLMYRSYRYWFLSYSTIINISQPIFVLPLAYFILSKFPTNRELLGGCIIMIGAFWLAWIYFLPKKNKVELLRNTLSSKMKGV